jgi:hypothetical protein
MRPTEVRIPKLQLSQANILSARANNHATISARTHSHRSENQVLQQAAAAQSRQMKFVQTDGKNLINLENILLIEDKLWGILE